MLWRFSANHTHLYPGALLRCLESPDDTRLAPGDELLLEFSDGVCALGRLAEIAPADGVLDVPAFRTERGADVAARRWRIVPAGETGLVRIAKRLPTP